MIRKACIDFSTFRNKGGKEVIKEVTVVEVDSGAEQHFIVKPPVGVIDNWSSDRNNGWMSRHYHGLDFHAGYTDYESLTDTLAAVCNTVHLLFTETSTKAKALEKFLNPNRVIFPLDKLGCPPRPPCPSTLCTLYEVDEESGDEQSGEQQHPPSCLYHSLHAPGFFCTRTTSVYMAEWCAQHPELIDMNNPAVREKTFAGWTLSEPSAKDLADSGFVKHSHKKDMTRCVYCGLALHEWVPGDVPDDDHLYNSPFCKYLRYKCQLQRDADASKITKKARPQLHEFSLRYAGMEDLTEKDVHDLCSA